MIAHDSPSLFEALPSIRATLALTSRVSRLSKGRGIPSELTQKAQNGTALFSRQPFDVGGEHSIDVQRLAFCHRMGANNWMRCLGKDLVGFGDAHQSIVP